VGSDSQCLLSRTQTTGGTNPAQSAADRDGAETVQRGDQGHEEFGIECAQCRSEKQITQSPNAHSLSMWFLYHIYCLRGVDVLGEMTCTQAGYIYNE
jgi:hypothetical protein